MLSAASVAINTCRFPDSLSVTQPGGCENCHPAPAFDTTEALGDISPPRTAGPFPAGFSICQKLMGLFGSNRSFGVFFFFPPVMLLEDSR